MRVLLQCRKLIITKLPSIQLLSLSQASGAAQTKAKVDAKPFSEIPGPKSLPFIGTALDYTKFKNFDITRLYDFVKKRHEKLGPIYKESVYLGVSLVVVSTISPEDVEALFRSGDRYPNRPGSDVIAAGREANNLHAGITHAQGKEWYQMRQVYNEQLLTTKTIWQYTQQHLGVANDFAEYVGKNLDANNEVPDLDNVLCKWALESVVLFALNSRLGAFTNEMSDDAKSIIDTALNLFRLTAKMTFSLPFWKIFSTKDYKELVKQQKLQFDSIQRFIASRPNVGCGAVEKAITASNMTSRQREIVLLDILGAAVDTTSNAAAFVLYCLATNPEKQEILRQEINEVLNNGEDVTGKTLQRMRYLHAVNQETQRIFPLVQGTFRIIAEDMVLSGYHVPAGTAVMFSSNAINNLDEKYFDDPHSFKPERWLKSAEKPNRFALAGSFGNGARRCPGRRVALQEVGCLLIALLSRYKIEYHHEPFENSYNLVSKPSQKSRFTFLPL